MSDYHVKVERSGRSQRRAVLRLSGFHVRVVAVFVAAMIVFTYGLMFAKYGAFAHPVEYLYPAAFVVLALMLAPGALAVAAFHATIGVPVEIDARTIVIVVAISAVAYGAMARRFMQQRKDQTP